MNWYSDTLVINTSGKGLYSFTDGIRQRINRWQVQTGMCYLFIQHTSASLVIGESYDPTARQDMETFMERLVPEGQSWYRHTLEGKDDSTSHIRSMLTSISLTIPIDRGKLSLGTWQGVYLFEHRNEDQSRDVLLRVLSVSGD